MWTRYLIDVSFAFTIVGSLLASCGNIFIINSPSKIANAWFRPSIVAIVTSLGIMFNLASNSLAVILPSFFVNSSSTKEDVIQLILFEAIIVSVPLIIMIVFLRDKPTHPPSYASAGQKHSGNYK
jgi:putative copper export protein